MTPSFFHPEAFAEMQEAHTYYESKRRGLGDDFSSAVERAVERIQAAPESFAVGDFGARFVLVDRFPYVLRYFYRSARHSYCGRRAWEPGSKLLEPQDKQLTKDEVI